MVKQSMVFRLNRGEKRPGGSLRKSPFSCVQCHAAALQADQDHSQKTISTPSKQQPAQRSAMNTVPVWIIPSRIDPQIVRAAPMYSYVRPWFDGHYSRACLCRMIQRVYEQELFGLCEGVEEYCDIHAANVVLLKHMLVALVWSAESGRAA